MSDRTKIQQKKAVTFTYSQPTLAQKSIPGFGWSSFSPSQSIASPQSHDISRISLRPQAKLTVGQPGDIYEQEADNVAEQVMRMAARETWEFSSAQTAQNSLQHKCAACENEEAEEIQRKPTLQKAADSNIQQPNNIESQLSATQGGGSPLPDNVRGFMEPRFGGDFGSVRVHTGSAAVQLSRNLGAQAFTYGSDIYFGTGKSPGNNDLMAHELTQVVQQTDSVPSLQCQPDSDYVREILLGGKSEYTPAEAATYANNGSNDAVMTPKHNIVSDTINSGVNGLMGLAGYDTRARPATEDNDFYRDYAQYMPGYNIDGIPSGAWAQNAATNHVGHGTAPGNPWDNVRRSLVQQEKSMIDADLKGGGTGQLSFWDLYSAHENAYDTSGGGGNGFIDPASFALAVYGAPALEAVGIDSGPITGASIDIFNNPEDSSTQGWAKRMGLAGSEVLGGGLLASHGAANIATGNIITGGSEVLGGLGMVGLGGFSAAWNTASAIDRGMLDEWGNAISEWGSSGSKPGDYPSPSPNDPVYA